jgi:large subunit ribosomal protein L4
MANVDVKSIAGKKAGSIELDASVFEAEIRPDLFHAEVRRQLAGRRSGTHSTKNRAFVSGGGAKPHRQKGTGRARAGSSRSPIWTGGGVVFGPVPRGYSHSVPKKVRAAALRSALSLRQSEGNVVVVDSLDLDEYKTKAVLAALDGLGLAGKRVLIVIEEAHAKIEGSARNLPGVGVVRAEGLNTYDVLRHQVVLATQASVAKIAERLARATSAKEATS